MKIPENKTLQELFEWRFSRTPDSVAHKFLDRETTYKAVSYTHLTLPTNSGV